MPALPSWTRPGGPRGRVMATRAVLLWSTTRTVTHGPRSWAPAPHCWVPQSGGPPSPVGFRRACSALLGGRVGCRARRSGHAGSTMRVWSSCVHAQKMVRKSGAAAMAALMVSCPSLPTPTPMPCPSRSGTTVSTSSLTRARTATTASRLWREWFRSTAAHNTVEIGGLSQSESGGPFLWTTQVRTTTLTSDVGEQQVQTWCAEHDGYLRLDTPTMHRRSATLNSPERRLTFIDTFDATEVIPVRLSWHLGPGISVDMDGVHATLFWGAGPERKQGKLVLDPRLDWTLQQAEVEPIAGWYSPRFGTRVEATCLVGLGMVAPSTSLTSELELP